VNSPDSVDLSIIIVTYNNEREIEQCLSSVKFAIQSLRAQLIIIDNDSGDNTVTLIKNQKSLFKRFNLIENNFNFGFTKAVNQGLKQATGNYVLLLNPDTKILPDTFKKLFPLFKKDEQIGIIAPQFLNADGSIQPSCRRFPRHRDVLFHILGLTYVLPHHKIFNYWKMGDFDHAATRYVDQPQGAFLLTHRKALEQVGLLDEQFPMFFSDVDWCRRQIENRWKILFTTEVNIIHHKGRSVYQNRVPLIWSSHISFYRYLKKYYPKGLWQILNFLMGGLLILAAVVRICIVIFQQMLQAIIQQQK